MVAEELALSLAEEYVLPGHVMADPFCGSGRLLAASCEVPSLRLGFDVNPLACLLSKAKFADASADGIRRIVSEIPVESKRSRNAPTLVLPSHRKVDWFSERALRDLSEIIAWINSLQLDPDERLLVAATLSAVTRDVSFARKTGWKLHRMSATDREAGKCSDAWTLLSRRLGACAVALERAPVVTCMPAIVAGDCTDPAIVDPYRGTCDVILTAVTKMEIPT